MRKDDLAAEALTWVGTPFHANQALKGVGADCVGTIYGIATACGIVLKDTRLAYPMRPDGTLKSYLVAHLDPVIGQPQEGDILLMSFGGEPHHVAMMVDGGRIVHAYSTVRKCVVQAYTDHWRAKVRGIYRFPGVE